jgi:hypothetical protein
LNPNQEDDNDKSCTFQAKFFWHGIGAAATAGLAPLAVVKPAYAAGVSANYPAAEVDMASAPNSNLTGSQKMTGMVFDTASLAPTIPNCDPNAVWLEGTSHTVAALLARVIAGPDRVPARCKDLTTAIGFLNQIQTAQTELGGGTDGEWCDDSGW